MLLKIHKISPRFNNNSKSQLLLDNAYNMLDCILSIICQGVLYFTQVYFMPLIFFRFQQRTKYLSVLVCNLFWAFVIIGLTAENLMLCQHQHFSMVMLGAVQHNCFDFIIAVQITVYSIVEKSF